MNGFAESDEPTGSGSDRAPRLRVGRGIVRSFPWVILLVVLGAMAGLVAGLLEPNRYESNAKLLLRLGAREQMTSEVLVDFGEGPATPPPTIVDEIQMLSDIEIFERVAREVGADALLRPADPTREDGPLTSLPVRMLHRMQALLFHSAAALGPSSEEEALRKATKTLQEDTRLQNEPGSSVIHVTHTSSSPERARTIVDALLREFVLRHTQQFSIETLLVESRRQLESARQARDAAAQAYVDQVGSSGIAVLQSQVPRVETELSAIESDVFAARLRKEEIGRMRASLSDRLEGIPEEIEILRPAVYVPNEEYETQLALKRTLLSQKQEMLVRDRPGEERRRREKEFDNQIAKIEDKLRITPKTIEQGTEMLQANANLPHSEMQNRIADLAVEEETLPAKLNLLETRLEAKKARLNELQKQLLSATMTRDDLAARRDAEEKRYGAMVERLSVLEALNNIDPNENSNLLVLQAATLEPVKIGPKRGSLFLKGLLGGIVAALAFAIVRQRFERRLRHPEVFELAHGVPVLGVVPHLTSLRDLRARALVGGR